MYFFFTTVDPDADDDVIVTLGRIGDILVTWERK